MEGDERSILGTGTPMPRVPLIAAVVLVELRMELLVF